MIICKIFHFIFQEVDIGAESIFLFPPEKPDKPVIDIPLHLVFLCFHSDEILKILAAILLEERIVFMSASYVLLTTVMQVNAFIVVNKAWVCIGFVPGYAQFEGETNYWSPSVCLCVCPVTAIL